MDNNEEINLEDQYKDIVKSTENSSINEPVNLGKVDMDRYNPQKAQDANVYLGYHTIDQTGLPSGGRFYPEDTTISVRAAKVGEIRNFSIVDETNLVDMEEKLNYIVKNCVRIQSGKKKLSYKDILEEDRFYILLSIRDLTFPEPENKLMTKARDKDGLDFDVEISAKYFQLSTIPEDIEKYYSHETRSFMVETKSFGVIEMAPPTIGIMEVVTDYIKTKQINGGQWDQSFLQILPYIQKDWRGFNEKSIFQGEIDFQGWSERKYMLVYRLAEKMRVGIKPEMLVQHEDEEVLVPINFRDGLKSLFIISDITGELL